eukprot:scaffold4021_cov59-Phaeocystis_antarctica.AAC.1
MFHQQAMRRRAVLDDTRCAPWRAALAHSLCIQYALSPRSCSTYLHAGLRGYKSCSPLVLDID